MKEPRSETAPDATAHAGSTGHAGHAGHDVDRAAIDVPAALNRLLGRLRWLETGRDGVTRWADLNNNVHLAEAVSAVRGAPTSHVEIHRIRQGVRPDPRGSVLWAIGQVLSRHSPVAITPDYFWVPATRTAIDLAIDDHMRRLQREYTRPEVR